MSVACPVVQNPSELILGHIQGPEKLFLIFYHPYGNDIIIITHFGLESEKFK